MHDYGSGSLDVVIDITTKCNAACPQCDRTDISRGAKMGTNPELPDENMTLNQLRKVINASNIDRVRHVSFCPSWGEPIINNDFLYMLDHLFSSAIKADTGLVVSVDTNGSLRSDEWWFSIGRLMSLFSNERDDLTLNFRFAVDGIDQAMHEKYRRRTNLDKVLATMEMVSAFPATRAMSQTVVFQHNQDYLNEIKSLTQRHGSVDHSFVRSERFGGRQFEFYNENDESETLTIADPFGIIETERSEFGMTPSCEYQKINKVHINYDGQVLPCCYFANAYVAGSRWSKLSDAGKWKESWIGKEYLKTKDAHNAFNRDLFDILEGNWWTKKLPFSWKHSEIAGAVQCSKHCSAKGGTFRVGAHRK